MLMAELNQCVIKMSFKSLKVLSCTLVLRPQIVLGCYALISVIAFRSTTILAVPIHDTKQGIIWSNMGQGNSTFTVTYHEESSWKSGQLL